jgi:hypothetical protein
VVLRTEFISKTTRRYNRKVKEKRIRRRAGFGQRELRAHGVKWGGRLDDNAKKAGKHGPQRNNPK